MRLILHTLKKDARRLWPVTVMTWVMLAVLANFDRWRADRIPAPTEGWMNLLLPLAWACLAALGVLEEPLVGDRNFWTTRPFRWTALLGAKLAFVVLAIHLPALVADGFVLAARGFTPAYYAGELLWKQVLFFGAVTLPAIALATLVRNFTHFVIAAFSIAAGIAILNGGLQGFPEFSREAVALRHAAVRLALAVSAVAVIGIQYARRRFLGARVTAVAGALAAAMLSAWFPVRAEYVLGAAAAPFRIELRHASPDEAVLRAAIAWGGKHTVLIPIALAPDTRADLVRLPLIVVEVTASDGTRIKSVNPSPNRPFENIPLMSFAYSIARDKLPNWLVLRFSVPAWERVKNGRVRIRGSAAFEFHHPGGTTTIPAQGSANVAGLGRCISLLVEDRFSEDMLKVLCESPRELPVARLVLRSEASPLEWRQMLSSYFTYSSAPQATWLSPLHRAQSFFRVTNEATARLGSQWLVPGEYVASAHIEITPDLVTGRGLSDFEFSDLELASRLVSRP